MNASRYFKIATILGLVLLAACRGQRSEKPPLFHWNLNMDMQNRVEAQEENRFFTDNRAMRQPVPGTISRGGLRHDKALYQGINEDSSFVSKNPLKLTKKLLQRGQDRFNVFCTPCHGIAGDGQGIIMTGGYGYVPAPSFHQERLRNVKDGYIYSVIAHGIRNMPSYAHQIPVKDRWAIVSYVRALQRSQHVPESEMQQYDVDLASLKAEAKERIEAQKAEDEAREAASGGAEITAARGKQLAQENACTTCHSTDGSKLTGPTWKNLYGHEVELESGETVTADEAYLEESIVNSQAKVTKGFQPVMPNFDYLPSSDVKSIVAYIKTLSEKAAEESVESTTNNTASEESTENSSEQTAETESANTAAKSNDETSSAAPAGQDTTDTTATAQTQKQLSAGAIAGKKLFEEFECKSCHTIDGSSELAPAFKGLFGSSRELTNGQAVIADEGYIKESIQYPGAKIALGFNNNMPSFRDLMTDQQLQDITDYIKSLK